LLKRYAVTLEYDGTAFSGWQLQENAPTVQAALEAAVEKRFHEKRRAGGASRTDTGVHARGQVAVFDLAHPIPVAQIPAALNSALPPTVRVLKAKQVPLRWDPRQQSTQKTYAYIIFNRAIYSPLQHGRAWQIQAPLDIKIMQRAARYLVGKHDFSAFRASGCTAKHPIRTVKQLTLVRRRGPAITVRITADAFLYHMVRNIVGTLVHVGLGKMTAEHVKRVLASRRRALAGPTAPAEGLYLETIRFGRKTRGLLTGGQE
jgi:tRNA pseudouridine38-40 synthase